MDFTLKVWRQARGANKGRFVEYEMKDVDSNSSFLEMLDTLNGTLAEKGDEPVAFEHDCREGICGACSMMINGRAHGPQKETTACQLHMRQFKSGDKIFVEPWRARAFPIVKDLVVDRSAFDRIIQAGGFISADTGSAPEANAAPIEKELADEAFDAATCIGCGACVAACPNGAAMLFTAAKVAHLGLLPQGQPERYDRVRKMVTQMDEELFGGCTNHGECQDACPKGIGIKYISQLNRDYLKAGKKRATSLKGSVKAQ